LKILVTGGAGFIGSHLCDHLLGAGHYVICVDNLLTGNIKNIKQNMQNRRFEFLKQDVVKPLKIAGRIDQILHFASPASPVDYMNYPLETLDVGSAGTKNLLELARKKKSKFLLASTSEVYGDPKVSPQDEGYFGNVNPIGPRSVYDEAKRFAEALTSAYRREKLVDARIARIFNTYGPRMGLDDGRVVPNFIKQALTGQALTVYGDGTQTRSFCYVSDMVAGIYKLMSSKISEPVNLGNPKELKVIDFAKVILELTGSRSRIAYKPLPQDDPKQRRPDISRAKKELGWAPEVGLEEGLRKTIEYFKGE
jgi:dTDP-glucose 4,6-dehydratase